MPKLLLTAVLAVTASAQTFTTLASFNGTDGTIGLGLIQGIDGNFYGTTYAGGTSGNCPVTKGCGTIFKVTPDGKVTALHQFTGADGSAPRGGLALGTDGNLYGTTFEGGANGAGVIFRITPAGDFSILHTFAGGTEGGYPWAPLLLGANGNFYGIAEYGFMANSPNNSIFEITPGGSLTTLYTFPIPESLVSPLVQGIDGELYGTVNPGPIFKLSLRGDITPLAYLLLTNAPLALGVDEDFYGTTSQASGSIYGNVFKVTPSGELTTLYTFTGGSDEGMPMFGLLQANDGNLYGGTDDVYANGTIFRITPSGAFKTIHTFSGTDGAYPQGTLLQATDGNLYGVTADGGAHGNGTVFRLSMGVPSLVKAVPHVAKAGASIIILGNKLTGASSVTFNGAAAAFTVVSDTEITATVPAGATSGQLAVTTPSGIITGIFLVQR